MKILDIALNDFTRSVRSLFAIGMMVVAPLVITGLIYVAFSGAGSENSDLPIIQVGIVNLDQVPADAPVALGKTLADMYFDESVAGYIQPKIYPGEASVRSAINNQEIQAAVIIPAGMTAALMANQSVPPVRILQDPTLTIGPMVVKNMAQFLLDGIYGGSIAVQVHRQRFAVHGIAENSINLQSIIHDYEGWFTAFQRELFHSPQAALVLVTPQSAGEEAPSADPMAGILSQIMTGQMIFFAFFTGAYSMQSILKEQEEGTLARLFTTPTPRLTILGGKFLAVVFTVCGQGLVLLLVGRLLFKVQWGTPTSVLLTMLGQVASATGLGVLLISFVKHERQAGPVIGGGLTALGMLGGLFTVGMQMPEAFTRLANFIPQGWVLHAWRLSLNGAPSAEVFTTCLILVGMGATMFAIGGLRFNRRFA
jgi:ABC-type multidrug transport system permease subunit